LDELFLLNYSFLKIHIFLCLRLRTEHTKKSEKFDFCLILTLYLTAKVTYDLPLLKVLCAKSRFNKPKNISIPGHISCGFVLLKVFLNSIMPLLLITKIVQDTKNLGHI
jgi:hypothetical protein